MIYFHQLKIFSFLALIVVILPSALCIDLAWGHSTGSEEHLTAESLQREIYSSEEKKTSGLNDLDARPAQLGQPFQIIWFSIDGGGNVSTADSFKLFGITGQWDIGASSSEGFTLSSGHLFVLDTCDSPSSIFCDGFESGDTLSWAVQFP